jgi:anti-sigma regulatory factor (Ser/Thr protein kinase)
MSGRVNPHDRVVLFYEEAHLRRGAGDFLSEAVRSDDVALVIATPSNLQLLEDTLARDGIDVVAAHAAGRWNTLDAAETMASFMVKGRPDRCAFEAVVGELVRSSATRGGTIRAYGEMVALLWGRGDITAAIELEELWNDLGRSVPFSLFCSYPTSMLSDATDPTGSTQASRQQSLVLEASRRDRPASSPNEVDESVREFPAAPEAIAEARHFVRELTSLWGCTRVAEEATLVISELASNAVRHANSPFSVTISHHDESLRLSVEDTSPVRPVLRIPDIHSVSGRGLFLVAALSDAWGVNRAGSGKVVWAELGSA